MIYTCNICQVTSDAVEFYCGVTTRCKECHKAKVRENRAEKADYYRDYDARRFQEDPKVKARHKRYQATAAGKASLSASRKKWMASNPEKRAAHVLLNNSLRSGRVVKPDKCSSCGSGGRMEGHHEDYARPLDVLWLCRQCHVIKHRESEE